MTGKLDLLIVEDEIVSMDSLRQRVQSLGFTCETAANPQQALVKLAKQEFKCILTDIMMPMENGMTVDFDAGLKFSKTVFSMYPKIKVIFITGRGDSSIATQIEQAHAAMELNRASFLRKPFSGVDFKKVLKGILGEFDNTPKPMDKHGLCLSCFAIASKVISELDKNNYTKGEVIFTIAAIEIIDLFREIDEMVLLLPLESKKGFRSFRAEGKLQIIEKNFNSADEVEVFYNDLGFATISIKPISFNDNFKDKNTHSGHGYLICLAKPVNKEKRILLNDALDILALVRKLIQMTEKNNRDRLTGLMRIDAAESHILNFFKGVNLNNKPTVTVIMLDIDNFKKINDSCGHPVGDDCIRMVAQKMAENTRAGSGTEVFLKNSKGERRGEKLVDIVDIVARWGGEEFFILLPEILFDDVNKKAEDIRIAIKNENFTYLHEQKEHLLTISLGVVHVTLDEKLDPNTMLEIIEKRADKLLYEAKHGGRNQYHSEQKLLSDLIKEHKT